MRAFRSLWFFFGHLGEKTYSVMNDVRRHRLFHFDFFIANQMIRSTVHVTHYVWLGCAPTMIGGHCLSGAFSWFFMHDVVASTLQKCRFRYTCWSGKNAGTAGWIASLLSIHFCVSVFFCHSQSRVTFFKWRESECALIDRACRTCTNLGSWSTTLSLI